MAKKIKFKPVNIVVWLVGILVALSVGSGMIGKVLVVPFILPIITVSAGWIIVVLALLGALLSVIDYFS